MGTGVPFMREIVKKFFAIGLNGRPPLAQMVGTQNSSGLLSRSTHRRQQQSQKKNNDGDHDEEFHQCIRASRVTWQIQGAGRLGRRGRMGCCPEVHKVVTLLTVRRLSRELRDQPEKPI